MTTAWSVAFVVLAATVALTAVTVLGLGHRIIATLQEVDARLNEDASRGASPPDPVGTVAPPLPLQESAVENPGCPVTDITGVASRLVIFIDADCHPCAALVADLARHKWEPEGVQLIAVTTSTTPEMLALRDWTIVDDPEDALARLWGVSGTPVAFLVDSHGLIQSFNIINTQRDLRAMVAAKTRARPDTPSLVMTTNGTPQRGAPHDHT